MARQRLYIVQGHGNDAVGLVGNVTGPIGKAGGNVVDLRQDVLHGLFTLHMVVDLGDTELRLDDLSRTAAEIAEDTGLRLSVEKYLPVPRSPGRRDLLITLLGRDRPGIIAAVSALLGKYRANIELAQTIAREGLFLMELVTDVSQCKVPLPNLMATLEQSMATLSMKTMFQTEDVFNKQKRILLFEVGGSLVDPGVTAEIMAQTGIAPQALAEAYPGGAPLPSLCGAIARLEGFPVEVMAAIVDGVEASSGTLELMQTLETMGYRIAIGAHALDVLTDRLPSKLGIDHAFGVTTRTDDDARTLLGEAGAEDLAGLAPAALGAELARRENVAPDHITVISDAGLPAVPGIVLDFDLGQLLHLFNDRVISREHVLGLLGAFGVPR